MTDPATTHEVERSTSVFPTPSEVGEARRRRAKQHRAEVLAAAGLSSPHGQSIAAHMRVHFLLLRARLRPRLAVQPDPSVRRGHALAAVLVLFAAGWGAGFVYAILSLTGQFKPEARPWSSVLPGIVESLTLTALLVLAGVLLAGRYGVTPATLGVYWPRQRRDWQGEAAMFVGAFCLTAVSFAAGHVLTVAFDLPNPGYPRPDVTTGWYTLSSFVGSAVAGVQEEIILLAVTVVVLRRARFSWPAVIAIAAVLRVSFHVYYGLSSITLTLWAVGMVLLYARTGRILGAVLAHSLWDVLNTASAVWNPPVAPLVLLVPVVLMLLPHAAKVFHLPTASDTTTETSATASWGVRVRDWFRPRRGTLTVAVLLTAALLGAGAAAAPVLNRHTGGSLSYPEAQLSTASAWFLAAALLTALAFLGILAVASTPLTPKGLRVDDTRLGLACLTMFSISAAVTMALARTIS